MSIFQQFTKYFGCFSNTSFKYHQPETDFLIDGEFGQYNMGGYIEELPTNITELRDRIGTLEVYSWTRPGTRVVFFEFNGYSKSLNSFVGGRLTFEYPPTGGVYPYAHFYSQELTPVVDKLYYAWVAGACFYYIILIYYIMEQIREFMFFNMGYFFKISTYLELAIISFSITFLVKHVLELRLGNVVKSALENIHKYPNFESLIYLKEMQQMLSGFVLFFIYLKSFRYLNFTRAMSTINLTLVESSSYLFTFSGMFFMVYTAFAIFGYLVFGRTVRGFCTLPQSMLYLYKLVLGHINYPEMEEVDPAAAQIFCFLFLFLIFFVFVNVFVAIMVHSYANSRIRAKESLQETQMWGYMKKNIFGCNFMLPKEKRRTSAEKIHQALLAVGYDKDQIKNFFTQFGINPKAKNIYLDALWLHGTPPDVLLKPQFRKGTLNERILRIETSITTVEERLASFVRKFNQLR